VEPVVTVTGGEIRGRTLAAPGGAVFKGIPFAQPPVGDLRWREPQAVVAWEGVRDAGSYAAPCAQIAAGWNDRTAAISKEDCLYLNVWAPAWPPSSRLPVMFWIHGGANMGGSTLGAGGIEPAFDGEKLARHGVVVVSAAYRLGVFGFMAHAELTAESAHQASGNYGLLDQVAALRWVHDNIAQFGGDPAKVTIFGQSAGGMDVGLLMASPLARGLFQRAIQESGTVIIGGAPTPTLEQAEAAGARFAAHLQAPEKGAIAYLRGLSAAEVLKASPPYGGGGADRPGPDVDGYALPRSPASVFEAGGEARVPLITGSNAREMLIPGGPEAARKAIEQYYGERAARALPLYGLAGGEAPSYPPYGDAGAQFRTDTFFRCPAVLTAGWHSAHNPTWEYEFTVGAEPEGARHSGELRYVFGRRGVQDTADPDAKVTEQIQTYWTNFAKSGNPNGPRLPHWPRYDSAKRKYQELNLDGAITKSDLRGAACALFRERLEQMQR
jgi:para-nitrobenzyl esterase